MTKNPLACLFLVACVHTPKPPPAPPANGIPVNSSNGIPLVVNSQVEGDLINCGESSLKSEAANLFPVVLALCFGQKPNWQTELAGLESQGKQALFCALIAVNADLNAELDAGVTYAVSDGGKALATLGNPMTKIEAQKRLLWEMQHLTAKTVDGGAALH